MGRDSGEDEDLGTVVLDVVRNVVQRLQVLQCQHKLLGLGNKSKQLIWNSISLCSKCGSKQNIIETTEEKCVLPALTTPSWPLASCS